MDRPPDRRRTVLTWSIAGALLIVPFIAMLWVGTYAHASPALWGIPFFYWYQLLWVIITAILTIAAYHLVHRIERPRGRDDGARTTKGPDATPGTGTGSADAEAKGER